MSVEFADEPDASRYTMRRNGELVGTLDYVVNGGAISLTRAFTSPPFRGKGHAAELVAWAVDDIERRTGLRIMPMCWYVGDWFDRHPERASLLSRSA